MGHLQLYFISLQPWAHNPQTIRSPDRHSKHGYVYAVYTLGKGDLSQLALATVRSCRKYPCYAQIRRWHAQERPTRGVQPVHASPPTAGPRTPPRDARAGRPTPPHWSHSVRTIACTLQTTRTITANFTIHWAEEARGPYQVRDHFNPRVRDHSIA